MRYFEISGISYAISPLFIALWHAFVFIFKRWQAPSRSWKNVLTVLESDGKVLEICFSKSVGTLFVVVVVVDAAATVLVISF